MFAQLTVSIPVTLRAVHARDSGAWRVSRAQTEVYVRAPWLCALRARSVCEQHARCSKGRSEHTDTPRGENALH